MKRESNSQTLGEVMQALVKAYKLGPKLNEVRLVGIWEETFGKPIAKHTNDIKLRGTTLVVELDSSVVREELSYAKQQIIETLNKEMGQEVVTEVIFR